VMVSASLLESVVVVVAVMVSAWMSAA